MRVLLATCQVRLNPLNLTCTVSGKNIDGEKAAAWSGPKIAKVEARSPEAEGL